MSVKITWNTAALEAEVHAKIVAKLNDAGALLRGRVVKKISKPFRDGGKEQFRDPPPRWGTPSKPGEPPRADTGKLRQSIFHHVNPSKNNPSVIVGTTLKYGYELEVGRSNVKPRPYLRPALNENLGVIKKIFSRP